MFLNDIHQVADIDWSRAYHWDVKFEKFGTAPAPPPPFDKWFPAVSVDLTVYNMASFNFSSPVMTHTIPQSTTTLSLPVTFLDDENLTLMKWVRDWVNKDLFHLAEDNPYLGYTSEVVRPMHLARFKWVKFKKVLVDYKLYWVYPDGSLMDGLVSESATTQHTVTFQVTGMTNYKTS